MRISNIWIIGILLTTVGVAAASESLVDAAKRRDSSTVRLLVRQHADVNATQPDGATALHWAAHWDDVAMAQVLLGAGANANATNRLGVTPLWLACTNGSSAMVETLLKSGANPRSALPSGETALMTCARTGNGEPVKALLAAGADVQAGEPTRKQTALMWAAAGNQVDALRVLIEAGADIHARTTTVPGPVGSASTAILIAARNNAIDAVRLLLAKGANINDVGSDGTSVLLTATHEGFWELAHVLLAAGADPNIDKAGYTPLHWMAGAWQSDLNGAMGIHEESYVRRAGLGPGKLELVKDLLAHGANPNARITRNPPRFGYYFNGGGGTRMNMRGATPFVLAANAADLAIMKALVDAGADPRASTDDHTTALIAAAGYGRTVGESHQTEADALATTQYALALGNDVNAANDLGETALHGAAYWGKDTIVQFLVDHGAQVNALNRSGASPLQLAEGHSGPGTGGNTYSWPTTAALLRKLGGTDVVEIVGEVDNLSTLCPQPVINLKREIGMADPSTGGNSRGLGIETNDRTRFVNLSCADVRKGVKVRIKGVREIEKGWNGLVMASEVIAEK
jgi:ankyrin repeat protein